MCGNYVGIRQRAHIVAEELKIRSNVLLLCPTCHMMFDTQLKPKLYKALTDAGFKKLRYLWKKFIYDQAAEKSPRAKGKKLNSLG